MRLSIAPGRRLRASWRCKFGQCRADPESRGGEFVTRGENGDTDAAYQKFSMSERCRHADPFRSEYQPCRHDNAARLHFFPFQTKIGAGFDFIVWEFNPRLACIIGRFAHMLKGITVSAPSGTAAPVMTRRAVRGEYSPQ